MLPSPPPLYGFDIETDTSTDGLDPRVAPIVSVAISTIDGELVIDGAEADILRGCDNAFAQLAPGVVVTWNGAGFDLPFVADRAARCGIPLRLRLVADASLSRREPLIGHAGGYRASWGPHRHLDLYRVFRNDVGAALHLSCSLKGIAKLVGLPAIEHDRDRLHQLPAAALRAYVASDARLTRQLALRRWSSAALAVDPA